MEVCPRRLTRFSSSFSSSSWCSTVSTSSNHVSGGTSLGDSVFARCRRHVSSPWASQSSNAARSMATGGAQSRQAMASGVTHPPRTAITTGGQIHELNATSRRSPTPFTGRPLRAFQESLTMLNKILFPIGRSKSGPKRVPTRVEPSHHS